MDTKIAYVGEDILYDMDLSNVGRMKTTATITSVVNVTSDIGGITLGSFNHDGNKTAQFRVSGMTTAATHKLTITFTTSSGDTYKSFGILDVLS